MERDEGSLPELHVDAPIVLRAEPAIRPDLRVRTITTSHHSKKDNTF